MNRLTRRLVDISSALISVLCLSVTAQAGDVKQLDGMDLVRRGVELTDLRQSGPFRLRWKLTKKDVVLGQQEGTDIVSFASTERWRRDLHMTGYDETVVFIGHVMYRTRSLPFTPPSMRPDLAASLRNLPELLDYKVIRVFNHKVNQADTRCVYLQQRREDRPAEAQWCFDLRTGLPTAQLSSRGGARIEFSNYSAFGNKFVPKEIQLIAGNHSGKATLDAIEANSFSDPHTFEPPAGATPRLWCDDMELPTPVSFGTKIDIPPGARLHSGLELNYELSVDDHGNITDAIPLVPKPFTDRIVIEAVRTWKFNPALCGGTPVPTDILFDLPRAFGW